MQSMDCCSTRQFRGDSQHSGWSVVEVEAVLPANSGGIHSNTGWDILELELFYPPIQGGFTAFFSRYSMRAGCSTRQFRGDSQPDIEKVLFGDSCSTRQFRGDSQLRCSCILPRRAVLPANSGGIHSHPRTLHVGDVAVLPANSGGIHSTEQHQQR